MLFSGAMRPAVPAHLQAHRVVGVACGDNDHDNACDAAGGVEAQVRAVPVQQGNLSRLRVPHRRAHTNHEVNVSPNVAEA
jgi:hypothetical protein